MAPKLGFSNKFMSQNKPVCLSVSFICLYIVLTIHA